MGQLNVFFVEEAFDALFVVLVGGGLLEISLGNTALDY